MKIKTLDLIDGALNWAVAKSLGYTMREPLRGTDAEAQTKAVPFQMYAVNFDQTPEGVNLRVWVEKITVTRFGVDESVGATKESISFVDSNRRSARASIDMFYFDEAEAQLEVNGAMVGYVEGFDASTSWAQAGPIIEREGIGILFDAGSACRKPSWFATPDDQCTTSSYEGEQFDPAFMIDESAGMRGPTPLIAGMRCFVASKLGETVDIPDELCGNQQQEAPVNQQRPRG